MECITCNIKVEQNAEGILMCVRENGDINKTICHQCFIKMDKPDGIMWLVNPRATKKLSNNLNPYYKAYKRNRPTTFENCPSKDEYETYQKPNKEVRKMTVKEQSYHHYMMNYWCKYIGPYITEVA